MLASFLSGRDKEPGRLKCFMRSSFNFQQRYLLTLILYGKVSPVARTTYPSSRAANMPSIRLHEQKIDHEFAAILDCANVGYATPFNGFWEVLKCPVLEEQVQRTAQSHREDESSRWVYITDEETGQWVGAMEWNFYKENPYAQGPPEVTADWWQEGKSLQSGS
jgi:hypothetical protein